MQDLMCLCIYYIYMCVCVCVCVCVCACVCVGSGWVCECVGLDNFETYARMPNYVKQIQFVYLDKITVSVYL